MTPTAQWAGSLFMKKYKKKLDICIFKPATYSSLCFKYYLQKKTNSIIVLLHLFGSLNLQISKTIMFGASSSHAFFNVYFIPDCYYILLIQSSMINYNKIIQNHS